MNFFFNPKDCLSDDKFKFDRDLTISDLSILMCIVLYLLMDFDFFFVFENNHDYIVVYFVFSIIWIIMLWHYCKRNVQWCFCIRNIGNSKWDSQSFRGGLAILLVLQGSGFGIRFASADFTLVYHLSTYKNSILNLKWPTYKLNIPF